MQWRKLAVHPRSWDAESNILSTNVDSPPHNWMIDVWGCRHSSVVLHLRRDILSVILILSFVIHWIL